MSERKAIEWVESGAVWEVRKPSFRAELGGVKLHTAKDFDGKTWTATALFVGGNHQQKASFEHKTLLDAQVSATALGGELIEAEILRLVRLRATFVNA